MPNMVSDGFLDQAQFIHTVATTPANLDYQFQNAVANAIGTAALQGLLTTTVNVSAYTANSNALIILMIERLVNMGYTASLSSTTLTVSW
jgi:hypothetical protein